jgi:hypothetical protein
MHRDGPNIELLRIILENTLQPHRLDAHPWIKSLIVTEAGTTAVDLQKGPGQRLVLAVAKLFKQMQPSTPPQLRKRLDTRWGEFGMLAAQYFAPLLYGEPSPASLRDAWGFIDKSILLFVFDETGSESSEEDKQAYKLVGGEMEVAPNSTLSDWNRNGLRRLLEIITARENFLAETLSKPAVIKWDESIDRNDDLEKYANKSQPFLKKKTLFLWAFLFLVVVLLGLAGFMWVQGRQIYQSALRVRQDAIELQNVVQVSGPPIDRIKSANAPLLKLRQDYETLRNETEKYYWLGPWLRWVPDYGGDLSSIQDLVGITDPLLAAAELSLEILSPLVEENSLSGMNLTELTEFLNQVQPQLQDASHQIDLAKAARKQLSTGNLSPEVSDLILNDIDPLLDLMSDGLTFAEEFPRVMGATGEGPKTYLLLAQNMDELRPTGGFITAVGTLLMQEGHISSMTFKDSGELDDWTRPYPSAPWQLQKYMNSSVLVLRDTNWFTNFPTAALYAETLYSYISSSSEDGVVAFDQQALVELLEVTGPVDLEGVSYPIDSSNVIAYMRTAKIPTPDDLASGDWTYKVFIQKVANALASKVFSGDVPLEQLLTVTMKVLNEHHLLIQIDNPDLSNLLSKYRWDGAIRPGEGDFLMAVDTNVGFNKTNAEVTSSLDYDVDLTTPLSPVGSLTVIHKNNSPELICKQWNKIRFPNQIKYPTDDCYWNYLRIYLPLGTKLLDSETHDVPANWMIVKQDIPAHADDLGDEQIGGVQVFGTLMVVPGSESLTTSFRFALPAGIIIQPAQNQFIYQLKIQKQPGTQAVPFTLRVHLPKNASIQTGSKGTVMQEMSALYQANLQTDIEFRISFSLP